MTTHHVVQTDGPSLEKNLAGPAGINGEPEFDDVEADVLVKRIQNELAHAAVVPGAVDEQQPLEKAKLGYRVVRGAGRLQALHAGNACKRKFGSSNESARVYFAQILIAGLIILSPRKITNQRRCALFESWPRRSHRRRSPRSRLWCCSSPNPPPESIHKIRIHIHVTCARILASVKIAVAKLGAAYFGFLHRRDPAANDDLAGSAQVEEVPPEITGQSVFQAVPVDDETDVVLAPQVLSEVRAVLHDHLPRFLKTSNAEALTRLRASSSSGSFQRTSKESSLMMIKGMRWVISLQE